MKRPFRLLPGSRLSVGAIVLVGALILSLGVAHIEIRQRVIQASYDVGSALRTLRKAQERNRALRTEYATLTDPERIRQIAEKLRLAAPAPSQRRLIGPQ